MKKIYRERRVAAGLLSPTIRRMAIRPLLLFFLLPTSCLYSQQLMERTLTLEQSVGLAISNSQQLLSAAQDIQIAKQRLIEARAIMYPQLEFNANYSKFNAESPLFLPSLLGNTILPQKMGELDDVENYYTTKISLSQVLWSAAKLSSTKKFAETELKTAESDYGAIKNKTVATAAKNFYKLLALQKKLDICNVSLEKLADRKNDNANSKNRFLADRNIGKIKAIGEKIKKDLEIARIDFLDSIGIELNTIFAIKGELEYKKVPADLNKCLAWAAEYRPELKKTQLQEQMDALSVNLSLSGRYPTVALGGNYQLEDKQWPFEKKSWNATVNLTLPIFDGFGQFARIKQKKYQYRKAQINRANISDAIKAEVRKSFIEYEYAIEKYEKKIKEAETIADTSELYKNISSSEYIEISEQILQMRLEYIDAVRDVIIAKIDLETVVGKNFE
ncbi:MAG: TolC family protein [Elusimicrobia bacterium]|nr:TolC family protein [Elusimicrobiota bacterium]